MRDILIRAFFIAIIVVGCVGIGKAAPQEGYTEEVIKVGIVFNLVMFVKWPVESFVDNSSPLNMCVIGKDPFKGGLSSIEGKLVKKRKLGVRILKDNDNMSDCHLAYVSASESGNFEKIIDALALSHVLTVGETPGFAERGGIVNLIKKEGRIGFEINIDAAKRANINISSELLKLATIVSEGNASSEWQ